MKKVITTSPSKSKEKIAETRVTDPLRSTEPLDQSLVNRETLVEVNANDRLKTLDLWSPCA